MKKLIKGLSQVAGIIIVVLILVFNVSLGGNSQSQDFDLGDLIRINKAEAECDRSPTDPGALPGHCNIFDRCKLLEEPTDCGA